MSKINQSKILVIVGPTASGKSDLGIELAQKFNGEIISADSRQVYRGLNIGTGKVPRDRLKFKILNLKFPKATYSSSGIHHHLLDVANPKRIFTVAQFQKLGRRAIKDILKRGKLPIIVGGTGQYIDALVYNMTLPEVPPNRKLRSKLEKQSVEQLFNQLRKLDPERAQTIDPKNPRRLIRALEIIAALGKVPRLTSKTNYDVLWLGLNPKDLRARIKRRVGYRLQNGAVAEVKRLIRNGVSKKRIYDFGLGYRTIIKHLQKESSKTAMREEFTRSEIQYAKRQMTWFKRNQQIHWVADLREAEKLTKVFV